MFACGSIFGNDASKENGLSRPAKGGSTPAFAYQRAAIAPLPCPNLQLGFIKAANSELASFKKCNCNRKNRLQNQFASQMWATRPHLASIFEKLLDQKTFCLPAACFAEHTLHYTNKKGAILINLLSKIEPL